MCQLPFISCLLFLASLGTPGLTADLEGRDDLAELKELLRTQGELIEKQQRELEALKQQIHGQQLHAEQVNASSFPFLASLPDLTIALPGEDYIRWSRIVVNADGAYDPDTGGFTAPVAGVYEFTVQLNVDFSDAATFFLTVNGAVTTGTTEYDPDGLYFSTATSTVILDLQAGDFVQVLLGNDAVVWGESETEGLFSWFTGHLIQAE